MDGGTLAGAAGRLNPPHAELPGARNNKRDIPPRAAPAARRKSKGFLRRAAANLEFVLTDMRMVARAALRISSGSAAIRRRGPVKNSPWNARGQAQ